MNQFIFALTSLLIASSDESVICGDQAYLYQDIHCCLSESIDEAKCEQLIDDLPRPIVESIDSLETFSDSADESESTVLYPNCYWFAFSYFDEEVRQDPRDWWVYEVKSQLADHFVRQARSPQSFEKPSLLFFYEKTEELFSDQENGVRVRYWHPYEPGPYHAALEIEKNILIQKEGLRSKTITIASLEDSLKAYRRLLNKPWRIRGDLSLRYFEEIRPSLAMTP